MEPTKTMSVNFSDVSTSRILKSLSTSKVSTGPETILVDSKLFDDRFRRRRSHLLSALHFSAKDIELPSLGNQANLEGCLLRPRLGSRERENRCLPRSGVQTNPRNAEPHHLVHRGIPQLLLLRH